MLVRSIRGNRRHTPAPTFGHRPAWGVPTGAAIPFSLVDVVGAVHSCIRPPAAFPTRPACSRATPRLLRGAERLRALLERGCHELADALRLDCRRPDRWAVARRLRAAGQLPRILGDCTDCRRRRYRRRASCAQRPRVSRRCAIGFDYRPSRSSLALDRRSQRHKPPSLVGQTLPVGAKQGDARASVDHPGRLAGRTDAQHLIPRGLPRCPRRWRIVAGSYRRRPSAEAFVRRGAPRHGEQS